MADETRYGPIAERLRAYYRKRGVAPVGSDYELVQQALKSPTTPKKNLDVIKEEIGVDDIGPGTSFLKGVGRGSGIADLALGAYDKVTGSNSRSVLEDPSNNTWSGVAGNLVGGIGGLLLPTGLLGLGVKGAQLISKAPVAIRAGVAGVEGIGRALGNQRDQVERGQRESLDPIPMVGEGAISAAGFGAGEKWLRPFAGQAKAAMKRAAPLIAGESVASMAMEDIGNQTSSVTPEGRSELNYGPEAYGMAAMFGGALGGALGPQMAKGAATDAEYFENILGRFGGKGSKVPPPAPAPSAPAPLPNRPNIIPVGEVYAGAGTTRQRPAPPPPSPVPPASGVDDLEWMASFGGDNQPFLPGMTPMRASTPDPVPPSTPPSLDVDEFDVKPGEASMLDALRSQKAKELLGVFKGEHEIKRPYVTQVEIAGAPRQVTVTENDAGIRRFVDQVSGEIFQEGDVDFHPTKYPRWFKEWGGIKNLEVDAGVQLQVVPNKVPFVHGVQLKGGGLASLVGRPGNEDPLNPTYYAKVQLPDGTSGYDFVSKGDMVDPSVIDNALKLAELEEQGLARRPTPEQIQTVVPARTPEDMDADLDALMEMIRQYRGNR